MLGIFSAGLASCSTESLVTDTSFSLYYSGISEICPGTNININPTWHGTKPVDFAIVDIRFNARPAVASCFSVDSESGVFSINGSDDLPTGVWTVGIECRSDGRRYVYEDAISINMMKPVPDGIFLSPSEMTNSLTLQGRGRSFLVRKSPPTATGTSRSKSTLSPMFTGTGTFTMSARSGLN